MVGPSGCEKESTIEREAKSLNTTTRNGTVSRSPITRRTIGKKSPGRDPVSGKKKRSFPKGAGSCVDTRGRGMKKPLSVVVSEH